jgi:hypothetical protein
MDQHPEPIFMESQREKFDELILEMAYLLGSLSELFRTFLENYCSHFFHILNVDSDTL